MEPHEEWQIDFKDVTTVKVEPGGKKQHVVEVFNVVDRGTSILLSAQVRSDYNAVTAIDAIVCAMQIHGCPAAIRFDRDPRFITSWSASDFPSAFMRVLMCLGIEVRVCPPRRPDKNPHVERYHRSLEYECLRVHRPEDVYQSQAVISVYQKHYNNKRPNQARSCGNQPPRVAFPELPQQPSLPTLVDPDAWLPCVHGKLYKRRVTHNGSVKVGKQSYYIRQTLKGQHVLLRVDALEQQFHVLLNNQLIKKLDIKGLHGEMMTFDRFVEVMRQEAQSEWQRYQQRVRYGRF